MINALVKIIATNQGTDWWCINNKYLYKEVIDILDWNNIIYTRNNIGIWFEHELKEVETIDTIEMLEKLRVLQGIQKWQKIKNVSKNSYKI